MKKHILTFAAFAAFSLFACQNSAPEAAAAAETAPTTEAPASTATHAVNTANSVVEWVGNPGEHQHKGVISLSSGELSVSNGSISGGKFTFDMNSLAVTDLQPPKKADLEGHLKDSDFFETGKFPTGAFEITAVEPLTGDASGATHKITGNLTLKGVTKSIQIPAKVSIAEETVKAETPEFTINRTEWGINYKSGIIGTIKDELIADDVKMKVKLEANAAK